MPQRTAAPRWRHPAPATPSASTPSAATAPSASSNPVRSESLPPSTPTATTTPAAKPEPPKPAPKPETRSRAEAGGHREQAGNGPGHAGSTGASGVGFAVQLGAFGQANDANALRDKVRAAGFSAFVEQVRTERAPCIASASGRWPTVAMPSS